MGRSTLVQLSDKQSSHVGLNGILNVYIYVIENDCAENIALLIFVS